MEKYYVDWGELEIVTNRLCHLIKKSNYKFKNVFGLQRGGLIPAVMVSHKLGIPMTSGDIEPNTLIIDDICDSGETLDKFVKKYQTLYSFPFNLKTAVLHYKPHTSCFEPTLYAEEWKYDDWVVYPWEREDSKTIQDYKIKVGESKNN
jgi:hypothetical protein|tara:strand:- start:299 stop:742 length:444 start_codon:yes stop_codon:yes gene_type:complete